MPEYTKKIVYLSDAQYQELITNKSITVNGVTVNYDKNMIYMTPQNTPLYAEDLAEWAKASTKPSYTAVEVGALPSNTHIPTTTAELTNDAGFITSAAVPTKVSDLTDDSGHYTKPATGIPTSDLSEEIVSTIDGKAPAIYCEKSGAIAFFDDGAGNMPLKECVVNIEPVQDLHGYDNPWPAGGGKNKMPSAIPTTVIDNGVTYTVANNGIISIKGTATADSRGTLLLDSPFVIPSGDPKPKFCMGNTIASTDILFKFYNGDIQVDSWGCGPINRVAEYSSMQGKTCDRYIITVPSEKTVDMTISPMFVENSITDYTYSPYSNICPITGWTGAKISRTGKNLADDTIFSIEEPAWSTQTYWLGLSKNADGTFTLTRPIGIGGAGAVYIGTYKPGNYVISFDVLDNADVTCGMSCVAKAKGTWKTVGSMSLSGSISAVGRYYKSISFNEIADLWISIGPWTDNNKQVISGNYQVELGSIATDYEPYQGETYDITFPAEAGTVYGGTLDIGKGTLTVDFKKVTLSSANQSWTYYGNAVWTDNLSDRLIGNDNQLDAICTHLKNAKINVTSGTAAKNYPGCFIMFGSNTNAPARMYICVDPTFDNRAQYVEWLDENTPELVYKLATPITYTLTPYEIRTLLGTNNIWVDTGNTAITYPVDTKIFVEQNTPDVPVQDVQVNGTSILQDGVANVPIGTSSIFGVVRGSDAYGVNIFTLPDRIGILKTVPATSAQIKSATASYLPISVDKFSEGVFYGLAKAAGANMNAIASTTVGVYPDEQKAAIQQMLGVSDLIATAENSLVASKAYAIGDVFTANGKLYKATAAIAADAAIITDGANANAVETSVGDGFVKFTDIASTTNYGISKINTNYGVGIYNGQLQTQLASMSSIKTGTHYYHPITPYNQHASAFYGLAKAAGDTTQAASDNAVGTYTDEAKAAIRTMLGAVGDVQVNGTSVITNNVANIPIATQTTFGVTKGYGSSGINIDASGNVSLSVANASKVKEGISNGSAIPPSMQHIATFYGLAKASGDTTQSASSNAVGQYTDNAKASIKSMLGIVDGSTGTVDITGTTPTITAVENTRYVCGEVTSLSFTPPASGICIVRFTSGSTVTILTLPSTIKFPEWFDPTSLETNTIYEICITDGIYGAVMSWAQ